MAENLFIQDSAGEPLMDLLEPSVVPAAQTNQSMGAKVLANGQDFWQGLFGNRWSNSTWDIMLLAVFVVAVLVYSFTWGRDKIVAVLMSAYLALIITANLPATVMNVPTLRTFAYFELTVFVAMFVALFFFLSRSRLLRQTSSFHGGWWQVIVFTILQAGLLTSGIFLFLPTVAAKNFSPLTQTLFLSSIGRFCWITLPIVALIFFGGRRRHHRRRGIQSLDDFEY